MEAAYGFAEWLYNINMSDDTLALCSRKLNFYQVLKRQGNLIKEQKKELFNIAEDLRQDKTIRVGAYLLLDNQIAAEKLFNELDIDVKQEFQMYPIFRFWIDD